MLDELRVVERKMGLVLTLFKASVWAIVMQQAEDEDVGHESGGGGGGSGGGGDDGGWPADATEPGYDVYNETQWADEPAEATPPPLPASRPRASRVWR